LVSTGSTSRCGLDRLDQPVRLDQPIGLDRLDHPVRLDQPIGLDRLDQQVRGHSA
jgi:hypothetical protein